MPPNHCALCDETITPDNDSREHIIPQAIGGRKAIRGFLCRGCNSTSGSSWDAALVKQLAAWGLLFGVPSVPPQTLQTLYGDPVKIHVEGYQTPEVPSVTRTKQGYRISAPSDKQFRQIVEGLIDKHPEQPWDLNQSLVEAKRTNSFNDMWKIPTGIDDAQAGRSIVKSALALAVHVGIAPSDCELACEYLRQDNREPCFDHYYGPDIVVNRTIDIPLHCVYIRGNPTENTLTAYIELFGVYRLVACLSRKYAGPKLMQTHAVNPVPGQKVEVEIRWHHELENPLSPVTNEILRQYIGEVMAPMLTAAQIAWHERSIDYGAKRAVRNAQRKFGKKEGDSLTAAEYRQIDQYMMQELLPLVSSWLNIQDPNTVKGIIQVGNDPKFDPRSFLESYYSYKQSLQ